MLAMTPLNLPPDDLPPEELTASDLQLRQHLDASLTQRFYQECNPLVTKLLAQCDWYVTTTAKGIILVIVCPDTAVNWQVLHNVQYLGAPMAQFSQTARIRICPPSRTGDPFEIRVDELPIYWD